jgi:hypothetical protein
MTITVRRTIAFLGVTLMATQLIAAPAAAAVPFFSRVQQLVRTGDAGYPHPEGSREAVETAGR